MSEELAEVQQRYAALHAAAHAYFHAATNRKATEAAPALRLALQSLPAAIPRDPPARNTSQIGEG